MRIIVKYRPRFNADSIEFGQEKEQFSLTPVTEKVKEIVQLLVVGLTKEAIQNHKDKEYILEIVNFLDQYGLVEDDEYDETKEYLSRYKNNIYYFENFSDLSFSAEKYQKKLNNLKVLFLGAGGASLLAASLAGMGIENIKIVDFDKIELSNLNRQLIFSEDKIGKSKVKEVCNYIKGINSRCNVSGENLFIRGTEDIEKLIEQSDLVINAIDTPPIEGNRWVNYLCDKYHKVLFCMGMGAQNVFIDKFTYDEDGCYDCTLLNQLDSDYKNTIGILKDVYSEDYNSLNTSFMPNILVASGIIAMEIFKHFALDQKEDTAKEVDLITFNFSTQKHKKNKNCPICGKKKLVGIDELCGMSEEGVRYDGRISS